MKIEPNEITHCEKITNPHYYDLSDNIKQQNGTNLKSGITGNNGPPTSIIGNNQQQHHRRLTFKIVACTVSRDQSHMAWLFEDGLVKWKKINNKSGEREEKDNEEESIFEKYTKESGRSLAFGDAFLNSESKVVQFQTTEHQQTQQTQQVNTRVKLSAQGSHQMLLLAVGSALGAIRVYDVTVTKNIVFVLHSHREPVLGLSFTKNLTNNGGPLKLASCSSIGEIKLWNMFNDGNMYKNILAQKNKLDLFACEWSPDGSLLCSVGAHRHVALWDMSDNNSSANAKEPLKHLLKGHMHDVVACSFSPDGFLLATGSSDTRIIVWSVQNEYEGQSPSLLRTFFHLLPEPSSIFASGFNNANVKSVQFTRDGMHLVSLCDDSKLRMWSLNSQSQNERIPVGVGYHKEGASMAVFDGYQVIVGSKNGTLDVYKLPPVSLKLTELCRPIINSSAANRRQAAAAGGGHDHDLYLPKECKKFLSYLID